MAYLLTPLKSENNKNANSFYCTDDIAVSNLIQKYSNVQFKKTEVKNDPNIERVGKQVEQYLVDCEKYNTDNTAELYRV